MDVFNPSTEISAESIRQDRIALGLGDWRVIGDNEQFPHFFAYLSSSSSRSPNTLDVELDELGWIFNRPSGGNLATRMDIRRTANSQAGAPPLFSGKMRIRDAGELENEEGTQFVKYLSLTLNTNPTRYLAHQVLPNCYAEDFCDNDLDDPIIRSTGIGYIQHSARQRTREFSLDGNDNILLFPQWEQFGRNQVWHIHLERYFRGIVEALIAEFERSSSLSGVHLIQAEAGLNHMLDEVENYIEILPPNGLPAIEFLAQIAPHLTAYRKSRVEQYDLNHDSVTHGGYAKSYTLHVRKGVDLKIYAKTYRRLRFEIRYKLKECGRLLHPNSNQSGRAAHSRNQVIAWLELLHQDTAARLNDLYRYLGRRLGDIRDSNPSYLLPMRIARELPRSAAETIIPALIETGCITLSSGRDPMRKHINKLVGEGILERASQDGNRCQTYVVTPSYIRGLDYLQRDPNRTRTRNRSRMD